MILTQGSRRSDGRRRIASVLAATLTIVVPALASGCAPWRDAGSPHAAGRGGSPGPIASGGPSTGPSAVPSAGPSASPGGASPAAPGAPPAPAPGDLLPAEYRDRIPVFPPRPVPERIVLPPGPYAPWISRIPTNQPVAFITIDDGWIRRSETVAVLRAAGVPVTLFLTVNAVRADPGYFNQLIGAGAVIEAHSVTHRSMRGMSYERQVREVCGSADQLAAWYGRRPVLYRPPFGNKDANTLRAVRDCGLKAAFFWRETVQHGEVAYQTSRRRVQNGDILLLHFQKSFVADFLAALKAIHEAGLTPALLEDYLP